MENARTLVSPTAYSYKTHVTRDNRDGRSDLRSLSKVSVRAEYPEGDERRIG